MFCSNKRMSIYKVPYYCRVNPSFYRAEKHVIDATVTIRKSVFQTAECGVIVPSQVSWHLPQSTYNPINWCHISSSLQQGVLHVESIDFSHTSTGWYAKGKHYEISTFSPHRFAGSPMAIPHDYNRAHLVQRRSARRQPGAAYPHGHKRKIGDVSAPGRYRVQRDRGWLPLLFAD